MASKEFKATNGIANWETKQNVITIPITSNSATTIDTVALNSFYSSKYDITIVQGSKVRTSTVSVQTDGTSVDSTEYGIVATGGAISGVAITATTSGSNMLLQVTITDAATTIARVRAIKNLLGVIQPYAPSAPTIGTATAGAEQATITFTAPADNGNATITSYIATSSPGNITGSSASSPVTVLGLTGNTSYTFTVAATNGYGTSLSSAASNSVTPTIIPIQAGYFVGGQTYDSSSNAVRSGNKFTFSNDSRTVISNLLAVRRFAGTGFANSGTAGYTSGGINETGNFTNSTEKMPFTTEASAIVSGLSLSTTDGYYYASMSNSGIAGYIGGRDGAALSSAVDKIAFSNDSRSTLTATLSNAKGYAVGYSNSGTAGYFAGGRGASHYNTIDKFTFSNDSKSTLSTTLWSGLMSAAAFANIGAFGYVGGGNNNNGVDYADRNRIDKFAFSNDTRSTLGSTLSTNNSSFAGLAQSGTAGYFGGGSAGTSVSGTTNVDKIQFSNDAKSTLATGLNAIGLNIQGFANSGIL